MDYSQVKSKPASPSRVMKTNLMELIVNLIDQPNTADLTAVLADIRCSSDFDTKLKTFLEGCGDLTATDKSGQTILHHLAMTKPHLKHTGYKVDNVESFVAALIQRGVDMDARTADKGNTALHYAAQLNDKSCSDALIKDGADLCLKNLAGVRAISVVLRHLPNSTVTLGEKLDEGIIVKWDISRYESGKTIVLDFNVLLSKSFRDPSDGNYLTEILEDAKANTGIYVREMKYLEKVLLHPLTDCFLNYRWHNIHHIYVAHLICHIVFSLTFSAYVYSVYHLVCDPLIWAPKWDGEKWINQSVGRFHGWSHEVNCNTSTMQNGEARVYWEPRNNPLGNIKAVTILWLSLLFFIVLYSIKEITKLISMRMNILKYLSLLENVLSFLILITFPFISLNEVPEGHTIKIQYYQYHVAAISVLFTWILNMLYIGRSPSFGQYVQMMIKISINFGKFFIAISSLLIAFSTSFIIMFPREASLSNLITSPIKVLSMIAGELGYNDLMYRTHWIVKNGTKDQGYLDTGVIPQVFPHSSLILLSIFIFIFPIMTMNLFFGIAVNDVQSIVNSGLVHQKIKMVTTIPIYEKVLALIQCVLPTCLHKIIKRRPLYREVGQNICEVDLDSHGPFGIISRTLSHQLMLAVERNQGKGQKPPTILDIMKMIERLEMRLEQKISEVKYTYIDA